MKHMLGLTLALFGALTAQAATLSFDSRADWMAAVGAAGRTVGSPDGLDGIVDTGDATVFPSLWRRGLLFTPQDGSQLVVADRDAPGYDFGAPASLSVQLGFPSALRIGFSRPVHAIGFDAGAFPAMGDRTDLMVEVRTAGGRQSFSFADLGGATPGFVGFLSSDRIVSLHLVGGPADPAFTNFTTNAVPEPSSLALTAVAALAALALRKHTRSR